MRFRVGEFKLEGNDWACQMREKKMKARRQLSTPPLASRLY